MPDISKPYIYCDDFEKRLKSKFSESGVTYSNWQDDDISDIRSDIRDFYRREQNAKCAYCKQSVSLVSANNCQIEHIVPKSKYIEFITEPKNLCVICADCNEIKRNQEVLNEVPNVTEKTNIKRYPKSSNAFKIIHPHFDNYNDHILEINGFYLDKSLKGSYTILFCKLNRKLHKIGYENPVFSDAEVMILMENYLSEKDSLKRNYIIKRFQEMLILI